MTKKQPKSKKADHYERLKAIWQNEGIDVAMTCYQQLGFKRYHAWQMIESWLFPKEYK